MTYDDSDMKIAGNYAGGDASDGIDKSDRLYAYRLEHGEIANARRLGATLADYVEGQSGNSGDIFGPEMKIAMHRQLLSIFALVVGVESSMPDRILTRACLNVFYDTLKKDNPKMYDAMSASGAFSFYYLKYRKDSADGGVYGIAESFAMLCGSEKDTALREIGESIFRKNYNIALELVNDMSFSSAPHD